MRIPESPLRFASLTRWRTSEELRGYAYGRGRHRDAVRPYRDTPWARDLAVVRFGVDRALMP